jgi:hypothetical protein
MRGLFDQLHRDLRGLTRDGYLRIEANWSIPEKKPDLGPNVWQMCEPVATKPGAEAYAVYTLAFTSVGQWGPTFTGQVGEPGAVAEVLYTSFTKTPDDYLNLAGRKWANTPEPIREDPRRGVLSRAIWVMDGVNRQGAGLWYNCSDAAFLAEILNGQRSRYPDPHVPVAPLAAGLPPPVNADSLRRVMVTCASEFYVEYWLEEWKADHWEGRWESATKEWNRDSPVWPKALRITAVVHDPGDIGPAELDSSGNPKRHRGYALQEVFWLGDP